MSDTILVGTDGSDGANRAVAWAAATAAVHGDVLRIVSAVNIAGLYYGGGAPLGESMLNDLQKASEGFVREAEALARSLRPGLRIEGRTQPEAPVPLLVEQSRDARMLVVGSAGRGQFLATVLGSTTSALVGHAQCPVAVVRGRAVGGEVPDDGPVVAGIDGSPTSERAIAVAFEEASLRKAPLVALHAWSDVVYDSARATARLLPQWESLVADEERLLAERLAGWQEKYPDVEISRDVRLDRPRHALLELSERARLVVVGSHGRGGFAGMLLGSTGQALVQHAGCPVLVVRPEVTR
ncbi:universal stress protein [Amycolatopsis sp. NPDC059021]|uniref:universal stress protein n=1 Tax=Amycolatopsis sp. NPDC059021 TaxID=3346704 RepID=UPI0036731A34